MEEVSALDVVLRTALGMGIVQWLAFIFSIIYVILAAVENIWCWPFGIVSVILMFFVCIDPEVRYYSDAVLQVFYLIMSIYGWWKWGKGKIENENSLGELELRKMQSIEISKWKPIQHLYAFIIGGGLVLITGWFWGWMGANLPYTDAATTSFSVVATIMVAHKILENWIYWIVIDVVYIYMYIERGLYLFSIMYFFFCVIAIFGYLKWKRKYALQRG